MASVQGEVLGDCGVERSRNHLQQTCKDINQCLRVTMMLGSQRIVACFGIRQACMTSHHGGSSTSHHTSWIHHITSWMHHITSWMHHITSHIMDASHHIMDASHHIMEEVGLVAIPPTQCKITLPSFATPPTHCHPLLPTHHDPAHGHTSDRLQLGHLGEIGHLT